MANANKPVAKSQGLRKSLRSKGTKLKKKLAKVKLLSRRPAKSEEKAEGAGPRRRKRDVVHKFMTRNPLGKKGVSIAWEKYEEVRRGIFEAIYTMDSPTYADIVRFLERKFAQRFDGDIPWYAEIVKLDLEARNLIRRVIGKPERYSKAA